MKTRKREREKKKWVSEGRKATKLKSDESLTRLQLPRGVVCVVESATCNASTTRDDDVSTTTRDTVITAAGYIHRFFRNWGCFAYLYTRAQFYEKVDFRAKDRDPLPKRERFFLFFLFVAPWFPQSPESILSLPSLFIGITWKRNTLRFLRTENENRGGEGREWKTRLMIFEMRRKARFSRMSSREYFRSYLKSTTSVMKPCFFIRSAINFITCDRELSVNH